MLRRWGILLGMLTLIGGMAVATGSASAATVGFRPGGPIHLVGSAAAVANARGGIRHQAESTNWSGYAATTGTYTSVSASWTEPTGTCSGTATYSNTVRPGDHFNASVTYTGSNHFSLFIQDATQGWSHTTVGTLAGAARSSAEVIVEAPCCTFSGGILPLANFGTVNITGSLANGAALGNAGGVTQIIMVDSAGRDKDTVSSLSGGESFSATWLRSN